MKQTFFLLLFKLLISQSIWTQELKYSYKSDAEFDIETYLETITKKQLSKINGAYKKQRKGFYQKQLKSLKSQLSDSTFIFNDDLSTKIENIYREICLANLELKNDDFCFFIDRSLYPNASAYGNGVFVINLGLFTLLDSEDEIAFVICHELAHHSLLHIKKKIDNYISKTNSKELKYKISKIKRKRYGQNSARMELLKDLNFDFSEHSRESEIEADIKGFDYFSKTKYDKNAAISALKKLGNIEKLVFRYEIDWEAIFNLNDYRFNKNLLIKEESMFNSNILIDDNAWDIDSLKSHPDINIRINKLITSEFDLLNNDKIEIEDGNKEVKRVSEKLSVMSAFDQGNLDLAIYKVAVNLEKKDNDKSFFVGKMALILKKLYILKKNHSIGKYVPNENNLSDEIYLNMIRRFIHNIDMYELKKLIKNYTSYHIKIINDNKDLVSVHEIFNKD
ncbi:M48 family metallopeptidase [Flavivirga spongiicola]|uniref:M48 family metallopeptidase n=1 Tax=Flavivirga spongiicola TaxID=421621 RepID=A0ABU7XWH1_9FLAO|nr:M48 family metallopeptidase [Flavivirga sp. MEBiC05379]MDO5980125.1 M48 family metallopeptidase [Flavivirga sp. MEBiC05379]